MSIKVEKNNKDLYTSSRLNSTPPIGAPNATETPAADAADKIYKRKEEIFFYV